MGFKIAWLGFSGREKGDVLASMGLMDTGIHDEANESPIAVASFPNGWTIFFLNEFLHPITRDESLASLSTGCMAMAGQIHEGIMYSSACLYENGKMTWSVSHDAQAGRYDIEVRGNPPPAFAEIKRRLSTEQDNSGGENAEVDYIFNVPVDLAKAICGFEYCRWRYDWGEPHFTEVVVQARAK